MSKLLTFQKILPACEEEQAEAWRAFLSQYSPVAFELLDMYVPWTSAQRDAFWRDALLALSAEDYKRLRAFPHQAEREFLVELRAFLFERAQPLLDASKDSARVPGPTREKIAALLEGAPLLHQEIMFLKLAGYSDRTLEQLLRTSPSVGAAGLERLKAEYGAVLEGTEDRCPWPAAWLEMTRSAREARKPDCPVLRQMIRALDGQISWYEKDPLEQHRARCLSCLEHWTALLEVVGWAKRAHPWRDQQVNVFLSALPLNRAGKVKMPFLKRLFA